MRVTLITASSPEYWPLLQLTAHNKLEYCLRHGFQLHVAKHESWDPAKYATFWGERETFMLDALDTYDTDWVWFMGADTLITNMVKDIRTLCLPEYDFVVGVDINGINNDSILLRNSVNVKRFLKRVLYTRDQPHDQAAMFLEMKNNLRTMCVGQRAFNSFKYDEYNYGPYPKGNWEPGDFVVHFPGMPLARRLTLANEFLNKIVR